MLESIPDNIEGIGIECDILCARNLKDGNQKTYRHLLESQWLSPTIMSTGIPTFNSNSLRSYKSIIWINTFTEQSSTE